MIKLGWKPLEERRAETKLKLFFKANMGMINIPFQHIKNNAERSRYSTRQSDRSFAIPASNVDSHLHSFYPNTVRLWNSLPEEGKLLSNVDSFGNFIGKITLRSTYTD